jgi:hypothetical protein
MELSLGWHEAIAAGELERTSNSVLRFTGQQPLDIRSYFSMFPDLLRPLQPPPASSGRGPLFEPPTLVARDLDCLDRTVSETRRSSE